MSNLYRFLMVLMMACMMPARAQHPFTLTTASDITNGTQNYYLMQSLDRSTFYAIPHSDDENSKVSTTSIPNANMRWYFMDAENSDHQYYYIVNSTGRCLYHYDNNDDGIQINKTYADLSSLSNDELNKYKFYLTQTGSNYYIHPKDAPDRYLNKRGTNHNYADGYYIKASTYTDAPSKWQFVDVDHVTWPQPFTVSTDVEKHYYKFQNVNGTSFYLSNSGEWATVSNSGSEENIWYFLDAGTDATYSSCHYYFIVNVVTNKYLYYIEGTENNVSKVMDYNPEEADKYRFLIVDAAYKPNNNYATAYTIIPKLRQAYFSGKNSFAPIAMSNDSHFLLKNDRGSDNYDSHWTIVETEYVGVTVEAPTITNNYNGTISLSTTTPGATIYYTINGDTPNNTSTEYSSNFFSLGDATVIKAIAYLGSDYSNVSIYNVPKYTTPTISFDSSTSEVTITSEGTVYYNTGDGSQAAPTPSSGTLYNGPFPISSDITVKAIATQAGYLNSDVATWPIPQIHDYSQDYLTFDILTNGTLKWKSNGTGATKTISYKINNGDWTSITSSSSATISVSQGDVVQFRGSNARYCEGDKNNYSGFADGTAKFNVSGNIMSMIAGDDFENVTTLSSDNTWMFTQFFKQSKVISAENLILPATSLTEYCYRAMFSKCTTLEVAPALPATTLASYCYYYMFEGCAITEAPELHASTLASNCYGYMFTGCTSLNYIKCLATNKSASNCLQGWVTNVSSTGTFEKDENTSWTTGNNAIPTGWRVENYLAAPEAPVITCDGEFITITCETYHASIYYRLGQTGEFSLYSASIPIQENTTVEAYAVKNGVQGTTAIETCIATKSYQFAGMEITQGPLYYGSNGYEIKDSWNYDSYNSVYGKNVGSTYFNFIELGQLFESSVFSTSDGDIEKVLYPLGEWRIPTNTEWASILGTTRSGSTVNGSSNKHYAMIQLTGVTHSNSSTPSGLLIFPDGETITGATLANMDNTTSNTGITASELNNYLNQGCIFLPGSGYYDGNLQTWNSDYHYWSSIEYDSSTGYDLYFEPSNSISSADSKDKGTYYFPVYLVKDAADKATRLLRTWTYNNAEVELPYSVNAIDGHSASYAKGSFSFTTDVKVKEAQPTYLWFQHADQSADIYVNDTKVETHWGGYNAFFTNITDYVATPGVHNIRVVLNNTTRNTLAPYAGDFNFNATLGEVKLISSPVVPDSKYGYDGFHITSTVTSASATITVKTTVPKDATVTCSIKGKNCDYPSTTQTSDGTEMTFTTTIPNPRLWNGTLDPYLYDVTLTIAKDGIVYHKFKRGYGLRFFEYVFDNSTPANSRFMLNGSPYLLRGVCMHNDLEGKANALTAADNENDFEILKDLGCNFIRLAHYPHPKEIYDWCDKMGIIVQTEAPWVNKSTIDETGDYWAHLEGQCADMVNQHYNHPCILFWGVGNEINTNYTNTAEGKNLVKSKIEGYRYTIRSLMPNAWVGYTVSHGTQDGLGVFNNPTVDWIGHNIYVGWYIEKTSNNPTTRLTTAINKAKAQNTPCAFSEYGCSGTILCHSDNPQATTTKGNYARHDIEYQMWLHEGHIAAIKNKPELLFTSQWQLFDIAVSNRNEGYTICPDGVNAYIDDDLRRLNNKGLVERDHRTKKDTYYLYKAWWNPSDKFVHICGKDYEKLTNRAIKCYTNEDEGSILRLLVNGIEIRTATVENNMATFSATDFNSGDVIRVEGSTTSDTFTFNNSRTAVFTTAGPWNKASNWNDNVVPTVGSNVKIEANATIPAKYVAHVGGITIDGGSITIADSAQLIHNNSGVTATVEKIIKAYSVPSGQGQTDGWYFIASPISTSVEPSNVTNMLTETYDFYRLNNTTWENYKALTDDPEPQPLHSDFNLVNGAGYLYANNSQVTLQFTGTLKPYSEANGANQVNVDPGWNLVGNPFACNVYANQPFYKMNSNKTGIEAVEAYSTNAISPCTGIIVNTNETGTVTFTKDAPSITTNNGGSLQIALSQAFSPVRGNQSSMIDNAIVSFNEGSVLPKFHFVNNAEIYFPQDGEEYAIINAGRDGEGTTINEIPLNFKATIDGEYTLTISVPQTSNLSTLILIDNLAGANVDLLQTPEYTFEAKTNDYASRFRLVFAGKGDNPDDHDDFAFISNGEIIVIGEGTLQIFDILGRNIACRDGVYTIPTAEMTPGVFVLRLINGEKVRMQKIIVR